MNGHPINEIVPAIQDPAAPNIMRPALRSGLYNPDACVRRGAVEAMGKMYGANVMNKASVVRKAEREAEEAKARLKHPAETNFPFALGTLTDGELEAFGELVNEEERGEEATAAEDNGGGGEPAGSENGGEERAGGAAAPEGKGKGKAADEGKEATKPAVDAAVVQAEQGPVAPVATAETVAGKHKKKQKQAKPAALGTAWFVQRGKELDSRSSR